MQRSNTKQGPNKKEGSKKDMRLVARSASMQSIEKNKT